MPPGFEKRDLSGLTGMNISHGQGDVILQIATNRNFPRQTGGIGIIILRAYGKLVKDEAGELITARSSHFQVLWV